MKQTEPYSYWKYPWQKWICLVLAVMQAVVLWMNINEYRTILPSADQIFSAEEALRWQQNQLLMCALNMMGAALFLGQFLIGVFCRSKRSTSLATGILLLVFCAAWGAIPLLFSQPLSTTALGVWLVLLLAAMAAGIYSLLKARAKEA